MLQIIKDETIIDIQFSETMHLENQIATLFSSKSLTDSEKDIILKKEGLCVSLHPEQDTFETTSHYVKTSSIDGGSSPTLKEDQWLVTFDLKK